MWWLSIALGAPEVCNDLDDDGDGLIDEGPVAWGSDQDADGSGSAADLVLTPACTDPPADRIADLSDCDDTSAVASPGSTEVCDGVDNDCDGAVDEEVCDGCGATEEAGSLWHVCDGDEQTWFDAVDVCDARGMALATIDDAVAQSTAADLLAPFPYDFWLGGSDLAQEGDWTWVDGTPWGYEHWRVNQPDDGANTYPSEDCLEMDDGVWNDRPCGTPLPYLCRSVCEAILYVDADGDGLGDPATARVGCRQRLGEVANGSDCDDANPQLPAVLYLDADGDGAGDDASITVECDANLVMVGGDCDDDDPLVHPSATEIDGNGIDDDCDGIAAGDAPPDPPILDSDGDGLTDVEEGTSDSDGDGIPDYLDLDSDDDGVLDAAEGPGSGLDNGADGHPMPPGPVDFGLGCRTMSAPGGLWWCGLALAARRRHRTKPSRRIMPLRVLRSTPAARAARLMLPSQRSSSAST